MKHTVLTLALGTLLVAACGSPGKDQPATKAELAGPELSEEAALGFGIASENCLTCHSVDAETDSPNSLAPSLTTVLANYDEEALFDDFRSGIHVGHETMPTFDFSIAETDALIAYLQTIQNELPARPPADSHP